MTSNLRVAYLQPRLRSGVWIAAEGARFTFTVPAGKKLTRATFHTPEEKMAKPLITKTTEKRVTITVPKFLVYAVVELGLE